MKHSDELMLYEKCLNYLYQWILFHETEENIQEVTKGLGSIREEVLNGKKGSAL